MAQKIIAHLGGGCLSVGIERAGSRIQEYAADPAGQARFAQFIAAHTQPIILIADLAEEDFHADTLPRLRGGERKMLMQRRLERLYPDTPFHCALPLPAPDKNHETILLCALPQPEPLTPWLNLLAARHAPLIAIHSAATVSAGLRRHFKSRHALLLNWQKHAGLRLSFFIDGQLRFSRLAPTGAQFPPAQHCIEEAERTRHYLAASGLLAPDAELDVCLLAQPDDWSTPETDATHHASCRLLDIRATGKSIGCNPVPADSDATPLLLRLAAISPPSAQYASPTHTRFHRLRRMRQALYSVAAMLAAGSLIFGAERLWQTHQLAEPLRLAEAQTRLLQSTTEQPANLAEMQAAAALQRLLESQSPERILTGISHALAACPPIRLERLSWQTDTATHAQTVSLAVSVMPPAADYRLALQSIERFRVALKQQGYEVRILPPANDDADAAPGQFSLRLSRQDAT